MLCLVAQSFLTLCSTMDCGLPGSSVHGESPDKNAENIVPNIRLDEAQAGIKIAGRNINNLRYTDDTTLMTESEEELKSLLMKVKEK